MQCSCTSLFKRETVCCRGEVEGLHSESKGIGTPWRTVATGDPNEGRDTPEGLQPWATHTRAGILRNDMEGTSMRSKEWKKHHMHNDPSLYAACCCTGNKLTGTGWKQGRFGQVRSERSCSVNGCVIFLSAQTSNRRFCFDWQQTQLPRLENFWSWQCRRKFYFGLLSVGLGSLGILMLHLIFLPFVLFSSLLILSMSRLEMDDKLPWDGISSSGSTGSGVFCHEGIVGSDSWPFIIRKCDALPLCEVERHQLQSPFITAYANARDRILIFAFKYK